VTHFGKTYTQPHVNPLVVLCPRVHRRCMAEPLHRNTRSASYPIHSHRLHREDTK
jgi:hypothetical protein